MGLPPSPTLLLLLFCNPLLLPFASALNAEGISLLSFKASISQDTEGSMANWNSSTPDPCSWNGVTCEDGKIVSLSIPKKSLVGSLHPSLGSLLSLRHINFRNNRLFGSLPPELFSARGLQSLVLFGNSFTGFLPFEIGNLSYLQVLDLSQNSFSGSLPNSLTKCKRLKALDLSHNNFTNLIPAGFGSSLLALEKLDLSYNRFNGSIPGDIGNLSNLQGTADLSHNIFSGMIPESLGNLPEKVYIDLTYNNLSGPIPQNGALENRGPTAFIANPGLCGPPLKNPCSSGVPSTDPFSPRSNYAAPPAKPSNNSSGKSRGLTRSQVAAIAVSDALGICLIAMLFFYCYWRAMGLKRKQRSVNSDKGTKGKKECMCFRKDESETVSENVEHLDLVPLDPQAKFSLDELLKASAFVLGKSGIGIVYKVVLEDGITVAVRRLGEGGLQRLNEFRTEVEAIGKVRHPNIVSLRAYYFSTEEKLLIYDYIPNGDLSSAIHGRGPMICQPLSWEMRRVIITGIAKGLAFLHELSPKKYVHGDLKPKNILLGLNMEPCISNFGIGRLTNIAGSDPLHQSNKITAEKPHNQQSDITASQFMSSDSCYQAPEALKILKPSQKWDVYSYGVILLELISGRSPDVLLETSEMDLVQWVHFCIEEKKPLSDVHEKEVENKMLDSKEKIEYYRTKMQELVLYKSRCDNRLNEITERASADKHEVEFLAKKYEEKYKQVAEVASKLTAEEAAFRDIQGRKLELQNAIVNMEKGGSSDGLLQVRADRIQSNLEELVKTLHERCKHHGLHVKSKATIDFPFGWEPGIQEGATDWDEDWDKFEDEGFSFTKDLSVKLENDVAPAKSKLTSVWSDKASTDGASPAASINNSYSIDEKLCSAGERITESESVFTQDEYGSVRSPSGSPERSAFGTSSQEFHTIHFDMNDISPRVKDNHSHGGDESTFSGDKFTDEPSWGAAFDASDDVDSLWGFNTKDAGHERTGQNSFFGSEDFGLDPIRVDSPSASSVFGQDKKSPFFDSVPSTPQLKSNLSPRFSEEPDDHSFDSFSRFDSFSMHDNRFSPKRESLTRFDSIASTSNFDHSRGFSFDDTDPFGAGPFKSLESHSSRKNSDNWSSF